MLDACTQAGRELLEAHRDVETQPGYSLLVRLRNSTKALGVHTTIFNFILKVIRLAVDMKILVFFGSFKRLCGKGTEEMGTTKIVSSKVVVFVSGTIFGRSHIEFLLWLWTRRGDGRGFCRDVNSQDERVVFAFYNATT